jgi:alanine racemase
MARNFLEINLPRISKDYGAICSALAPLEAMSVLKADAYGLGVQEIFKCLKDSGCTKFGVADLEEAAAISGEGHDTYILGDYIAEEVSGIVELDIIAPVTSAAQAEALNLEAEKQNRKVRVQFLIDTGMGRLGIPIDSAYREICRCYQYDNLEFTGIYSHFPYAYGDKGFSNSQVQMMADLLKKLETAGITFEEVHISNSDGIHNISESKEAPFNIARTGINLYGCFDLEGEKTIDLEQVVTLKSRLVAKRTLKEGTSIGYGRTYTLDTEKLVGTVAIGYADGLPISLSNSGFLIIRKKKCPILGRVSMDYTTVDLSSVPDAACGDEVICLSDEIPVSDWAVSAGTITYDIICSIGNRVKRVYVDQ